jgi:phage-related protein
VSADVTRVVETVFQVGTSALGPLNAIASAGDRLRASLSSAITPLRSLIAVAGGAAAATGLASLHSQAEDTTNVLAGMFETFGAVNNFNSGLTMARDTMEAITAAAGPLPGEAQQYIDVFQEGFANFQTQFGDNIHAAIGFSNRLAAVGISLGEPAQQLAGDIARLTAAGRGGAGQEIAMWRNMLPYINQYRMQQHQTVLNAETFNRLTQQQRIELLQNVSSMHSMQDMIEHSSNSWGAMTGALKSSLLLIVRHATVPLFEAAERALAHVNNLLVDSGGHLTPFAQHIVDIGTNISTRIVHGMEHVVALVQRVAGEFRRLGAQIQGSPWVTTLHSLFGGGPGAGAAGAGGLRALGGLAATAVLGPIGGMLAGHLLGGSPHTAFAGGADASATAGNLGAALHGLMGVVEPLLGVLSQFQDSVRVIVEAIIPPLSGVLADLVPPLADLFTQAAGVAGELMADLTPILTNLATTVGEAAAQLAGPLGDAINQIGTALLDVIQALQPALLDAIRAFADGLGMLATGLSNVLTFILDPMRAAGLHNPGDTNTSSLTHGPAWHLARTATEHLATATAAATAAAHHRAPTPDARGGTHMDFRHSRFEITQRFAEGFDPDRVAVAFAHDLEHVADHRLSGQLEPAHAVR